MIVVSNFKYTSIPAAKPEEYPLLSMSHAIPKKISNLFTALLKVRAETKAAHETICKAGKIKKSPIVTINIR